MYSKNNLCFKMQEAMMLSDLWQVMYNPRLTFEDHHKKKKKVNELLKVFSFEYNNIAHGSLWSMLQASDRPELAAASSIRVLTMLMKFKLNKVLLPSGNTPHHWVVREAHGPACYGGLDPADQATTEFSSYLVWTSDKHSTQLFIICLITYTHERGKNPSTETDFSYKKRCMDVCEDNRKENIVDLIFGSSKDTLFNFG